MTAIILKFPPRPPFAVRVERERDGEGWLVVCRSHGWLHGDFNAAIHDARIVVAGHGVTVRSTSC